MKIGCHILPYIEVYCDQARSPDKIDTRHAAREIALLRVISSYAFEIAMKSLWALDPKKVPKKHDLLKLLNGLKPKQLKLSVGLGRVACEPFFTKGIRWR